MSTPARGRGGGTVTRGGTTISRGKSTSGSSVSNTSRGRGRGRGRGGTSHSSSTSPTTAGNNGGGLLQKLRTGSGQKGSDSSTNTSRGRGRGITVRGQNGGSSRGRGNNSKTFNNIATTFSNQPQAAISQASSPAPSSSHRDFMTQMNENYQTLKPKRDDERKRAIQDGMLADPEKKTNLANAITPVGTCTDMCPQFERVERIVQNMVDRAEKVSNTFTGRDMPSEERMVKRFRRSAAGYDEQLPSDIRTPETLRMTLDYLLNKVVSGGERLAVIHKFVWDRTRGIRNDFSIQQVTKQEDVKIAVECYERIARFHILSLHQLSNPENLEEGEHFDAHQEREQLNNTLLSLMYYYDDNRDLIELPNEPEFRAYCIVFELQSLTPDLEDRMQAWPLKLLCHPRVQTAFQLYAAAANTIVEQGPLRPSTPFNTAQANSAKFWSKLASQTVPYLMACVAEMHFATVRFTALDALWRSAKSSPQAQQMRNNDWTLSQLQDYLAFDDEEETLEFCQAYDLAFKNNDQGEQCLDFAAVAANVLDKSSTPSQQAFSHHIVEEKRHHRSLVAIINGVDVATAIRQGLVVQVDDHREDEQGQDASNDDQSMFVPEQPTNTSTKAPAAFGAGLNPSATVFTPSAIFGQHLSNPNSQATSTPASPFDTVSKPSAQSPIGFGDAPPFAISQPSAQVPAIAATQVPPVLNSKNSMSPSSIFGQRFENEAAFPGSAASTGLQYAPSMSESKSKLFASIPLFGQTTEQSQSGAADTSFPAYTSSLNMQTLEQANADAVAPTEQSILSKANSDTTQSNSSGAATAQSIFGLPEQGGSFPTSNPGSLFEQQKSVASSSVKPQFLFPASSSPSPVSSLPLTAALKVPLPTTETALSQTETSINAESSPVTSASSIFQPTIGTTAGALTPAFSSSPQPLQQQSHEVVPPKVVAITKFPNFTSSAAPPGTPQRPQLGNLTFPSAEPIKPPTSPSTSLPSVPFPPQPQLRTSPQTQFPSATQAPISSSVAEPLQPITPTKIIPRASHEDLVDLTSRLILKQPQGLIEYFISHHVSNILRPLVKQWNQAQINEAMTRIRTRHLSRKFFTIWKEKAHRNILTRRAKQRRKLLAAAMLAEQEKKIRNEAELEAILAATAETKMIQEEHKRAAELSSFRKSQNQQQEVRRERISLQEKQTIGQKRKIVSNNDSPRTRSDDKARLFSSHKRSRTISTMSEPTSLFHRSTASFGSSVFRRSLLGRSHNFLESRASATQQVDSTKTDYFKLKAMGIDPNTPLIPDTAKSLEIKTAMRQEARDAMVARVTTRPSDFSASLSSRLSPPRKIVSPRVSKESTVQSPRSSTIVIVQPSAQSAIPSKEDPFLRELREARQSLASDEDWFRNQTAVLQKEINDMEELRKSQSSQLASRQASPQVKENSLNVVNGYSYFAAATKPGNQLSRTEERIRRTGAHGLANKPPSRDYVPVAMSRQSAWEYHYHKNDTVTATPKKRTRGTSGSSPMSGLDTPSNQRTDAYSAIKKAKGNSASDRTRPDRAIISLSNNAYAALQNHAYSGGSEDSAYAYENDDQNEYCVDPNSDPSVYQYYQNDPGQTNMSGSHVNDEDLYDEQEANDEEETLDNGFNVAANSYDLHSHLHHQYPSLQNGAPLRERFYDEQQADDEEQEKDGDSEETEEQGDDEDAYQGEGEDEAEDDGEEEGGGGNDKEEEKEEEEEQEEEEEEDDDDDDDNDDGTPGTYPQFSRAHSRSSAGNSGRGMSNGPGASADDALVLSD